MKEKDIKLKALELCDKYKDKPVVHVHVVHEGTCKMMNTDSEDKSVCDCDATVYDAQQFSNEVKEKLVFKFKTVTVVDHSDTENN